jgi:hypothetical protein
MFFFFFTLGTSPKNGNAYHEIGADTASEYHWNNTTLHDI